MFYSSQIILQIYLFIPRISASCSQREVKFLTEADEFSQFHSMGIIKPQPSW